MSGERTPSGDERTEPPTDRHSSEDERTEPPTDRHSSEDERADREPDRRADLDDGRADRASGGERGHWDERSPATGGHGADSSRGGPLESQSGRAGGSRTPADASHRPGGAERLKDPGVAAVISIIIPGLGQLYAEKFGRGILILIIWSIWLTLSGLLTLVLVGFIMYLFTPLIHLLASWDAMDQCRKINDGTVRI